MLIGDPHRFAIECHHEPIPNETRRVFGRMCIHTESGMLGDVAEPACMLNVTEGILTRVLSNLPELNDAEIAALSDVEAFNLLNHEVYLDLDRSKEDLWQAHVRYFKYDFLTQGGESFDGTISFITLAGEQVRILFTDQTSGFHSTCVAVTEFHDVIQSFFSWVNDEEKGVPSI